MQIDWITVSAQIVNFLVLVWLLQRFLYRPVLQAMGRREQRIADRLDDAERRESEADERIREFEAKREALDREREDILSQAREAADRERRKLRDAARDDVDAQRRQWQEQLEQEQREFADGLRSRTRDTVQRIARRALGDLADAGLEERIVDGFIGRLEDAGQDLRDAFAGGDGPLRIHTSFELEPAVRSRLTHILHEQIDADLVVEFDRDEELLCGIELRRTDYRLGWNLAHYLDELGDRLDQTFRPAAAGEREG
jgi:F-type H+-transporting ATPase subunit b